MSKLIHQSTLSSSASQQTKDQDTKLQDLIGKVSRLIETPICFVNDKSQAMWHQYSLYVERNKNTLRSAEETIRMVSFFMPGRFGDSSELGELIYGLTYVFGTINDRAIEEFREPTVYVGGSETLFVKNIKTFVSIIQHLQIFIELLAIKHLNQKKRWKLVLMIEFLKMTARLYLLYYFKGFMLIVPNEEEMKHQTKLQEAQEHGRFPNLQTMYVDQGRNPHPQGHYSTDSQSFLANSGHSELRRHVNKGGRTYASLSEIFGEILYIIRPVIYVWVFIKYNISKSNTLKSGKFGLFEIGSKWRAFLVSLTMDFYSYALYMSTNPTLRQRQELKRRQMQWIFYLLLTPFFEKFVKDPTQSIAKYFEKNNATVRYWIISTCMSLLCAYQQNYFNVSGSNY